VVRVEQNGAVSEAGVRGQDIYAVTAPIVVEAARRLLAREARRSGALVLGEAFDPAELLGALHRAQALELFGPLSV
jgi:hypothetical protein